MRLTISTIAVLAMAGPSSGDWRQYVRSLAKK
jgi:hypothetical protein